MTDTIGRLILDAEKRAKGKANGHTSEADCHCQVTVAWFTPHSRRLKIEPCADHPVEHQRTTKGTT